MVSKQVNSVKEVNANNDSLLSIFSHLGDGNNYDATLAEELRAARNTKKKKKKGMKKMIEYEELEPTPDRCHWWNGSNIANRSLPDGG